MLLNQIKDLVRQAARSALQVAPETVVIDFPREREFGDLAVNAFLMARELHMAPALIAEKLAPALAGLGPIKSAEAVKGYVNLRLDDEALFRGLLAAVLEERSAYGSCDKRAGHRVMVEFSAPNTNKPQHLGHMRNNFLGDSVSRLLANMGAEVLRANLYNDRGIQICKSMVAWLRYGEGKSPEEAHRKGDHWVGEMYVRFEKEFVAARDGWIAENPDDLPRWQESHGKDRKGRPLPADAVLDNYRASFREEGFGKLALGRECQEMLRAWEASDEKTRELWERMNGWAFRGFDETYARLGIEFDRVYRESDTWLFGKDLIAKGLEKGLFERRPDGAVEIDLSAHKLGRKVVLRPDGTSVYITQDIGTTVQKAEEEGLHGQVWVVAEEQKHHFRVLFKIMEIMGYGWASDLHHLAYGLVHLPEGRMKSREGKVVDADDLCDEVRGLAAQEIRARDTDGRIEPEEIERRAEIIGLAALRFMLLKVTPLASMTFNPKESVKFEGDTGARILYAYARLNTMIQDAGADAQGQDAAFDLLGHATERDLALRLLEYPGITSRAAADLNPAAITTFLLDVARELNRFYERCDILREKNTDLRRARLLLCRAAAETLAHACALLGMPLLERM